VAPLIEALYPEKEFNNLKVDFDIFILPKPSVITSVALIFSFPVIATPKGFPIKLDKSS